MNPHFNLNGPGATMAGFAALAMLLGIISTVFWMVCGWRAMRAHEKLADSLERLSYQRTDT